MKGSKSFSVTPKQHEDKAKGNKRDLVLQRIKRIPDQKKKEREERETERKREWGEREKREKSDVTFTESERNGPPQLPYNVKLYVCFQPLR